MKSLANQDCPVVLSITDTRTHVATESAIHRNDTREIKREEPIDIYVRAREIYFRARRHRPVRAASIF
jgi:hypothetical protein